MKAAKCSSSLFKSRSSGVIEHPEETFKFAEIAKFNTGQPPSYS